MSLPFATYNAPDVDVYHFHVDPNSTPYQTTDGRTTGPSPHVLSAGQIDRDKPSNPQRNEDGTITILGQLRCHLTGLQDDINDYLTMRMELTKRKKTKLETVDEKRIETEIKELLDGNDNDGDEGGKENEKDK